MAKKAKKKAKKKASKKSKKKSARKATKAPARKKGAKKAGKKKAAKKKARRTVMYSSKGKKLYAVRKADGTFKDIQQFSRAHAADIARSAAAEEPAKPSPAPSGM